MKHSHIASYREAEVLGKSREQLVPYLYQHLLAALRQAVSRIAEGDLEGKAASIEKAQNILLELLASLNMEAGGAVVPRLAALYAYFLAELGEASSSLDTERLQRIIEMIATLQQAWENAAASLKNGSGAAVSEVGT